MVLFFWVIYYQLFMLHRPGLLRMTKAAITPGTQPHSVKIKTINTEPHPWSITARGGNKIESKTRKKLI